ncbi:hypothetical protein WY13_01621 [Clostridium ljungdahlii]|uniref:Uncharacterized protein n=1 Tax=Clostridium ljungdahlii TaxID=1538 RepID=A0A168R4G2_9CLOT|nr:hypothetical protein WY13_01621 [Clostridium ljungdahlii]
MYFQLHNDRKGCQSEIYGFSKGKFIKQGEFNYGRKYEA